MPTNPITPLAGVVRGTNACSSPRVYFSAMQWGGFLFGQISNAMNINALQSGKETIGTHVPVPAQSSLFR